MILYGANNSNFGILLFPAAQPTFLPRFYSRLADYLPFTEAVAVSSRSQSPQCRDIDDQMFVELAIQGRADVLVTGDRTLLAMDFGVVIEKAADYKRRLELQDNSP